jgi:DNA-directed RNA polymerase specialized sigma24 family protein
LQRPKEVKAPTEVPEGLHTLEELVLTTHLQYRVHEALARFPEQQRTAVHLVYFERFTYDDVAVVLKTKRKQVDEFLKVAKRELCVILGKDGERIL